MLNSFTAATEVDLSAADPDWVGLMIMHGHDHAFQFPP